MGGRAELHRITARAILCGLAVPLLVGCLGFTPMPDETLSFGATNRGVLHRGQAIPAQGDGYVLARTGDSTRFGTPELIAALTRAAASVEARFPGTAPIRIGDLSSPSGGRHPRHGSHRTGRDADVLFYMTDAAGHSETGRGWLAYNRFGFSVEHERENGLYFFDDARNWHFARTLLLDDEARVQWLFVSRGMKARLLRYALAHETDPRALSRAAYALHQPADAAPHDDHFHVRIYCPPRDLAHGCRNRGLVWSWLRGDTEKPLRRAGARLDDEALRASILEPIEP